MTLALINTISPAFLGAIAPCSGIRAAWCCMRSDHTSRRLTCACINVVPEKPENKAGSTGNPAHFKVKAPVQACRTTAAPARSRPARCSLSHPAHLSPAIQRTHNTTTPPQNTIKHPTTNILSNAPPRTRQAVQIYNPTDLVVRLRDLSLRITFAHHAGQESTGVVSLNEANDAREIAPGGYHLVCWASTHTRYWLGLSGGCELPPECDFGARNGTSFGHLEHINGDDTVQLVYQAFGAVQTTDVLGPVNESVALQRPGARALPVPLSVRCVLNRRCSCYCHRSVVHSLIKCRCVRSRCPGLEMGSKATTWRGNPGSTAVTWHGRAASPSTLGVRSLSSANGYTPALGTEMSDTGPPTARQFELFECRPDSFWCSPPLPPRRYHA